MAQASLIAVCALCLLFAGIVVRRLRMRLAKHGPAALTFAVPGALLLAPGVWLASRGEFLALVPLLTLAALCFCAAALFTPTAATRFASFERQFWAHVHRGG